MSMNHDSLILQIHMEEYSALRAEILELIKWRDKLVFFSLAISGAMFSFAFTKSAPAETPQFYPSLSLFLIPPLSCAVGGLWLVNTWRIYRIGVYIRDVLAFQVNKLLRTTDDPEIRVNPDPVLDWQASQHRVMLYWLRRLFEWCILVMTFILSGIVAQYLLWHQTSGNLIQRIQSLTFPAFFITNCVILFICTIFFIRHLFGGRIHNQHQDDQSTPGCEP